MNKLKLSDGAKALVIVAHPDDETIWLGGLILSNPQANWTILCLSRSSDRDRAPKFARVAKHLKARGIMCDWDDDGKLSYTASVKSAKKIISQAIGDEYFDWLFTHNANGEYGHERHKGCHQAVGELISTGKLSVGVTLAFNYKKISKYKLAPRVDSDFIVKLSPAQFKAKRAIMSDIYGFDPNGIDINYCTNPESLKIINY